MTFDVVDDQFDTNDPSARAMPDALNTGNEFMSLYETPGMKVRIIRVEHNDTTNAWSLSGRTWDEIVASRYRKVIASPGLGDTEVWEIQNNSGGWFPPGTRVDRRAGVGTVTLAMLPSALTGHASHHVSPVTASVALAVHVAASAIWVGGLLGPTVHLRPYPEDIRRSVPAFSLAALLCVLAIGFSGVVEASVTLESWADLWHSHRGGLIPAKTVALVLLGLSGLLHRRRTIKAAYVGHLVPLVRLGAWELALMGGTVGIAVVLSTTA